MNRQESLVIPLNKRISIDEIFGSRLANTVTEPVSPYKHALHILLRLFDVYSQKHYITDLGVYAKLSCVLYGLTTCSDLSCDQLRRIVKELDRFIPALPVKFDEHLSKVALRDGNTHFATSKSHLATYYKKLQTARSLRTAHEIFQDQEAFQLWCVSSSNTIPHYIPSIPHDIVSSSKAYKWILKQLHLLQVSPNEAMGVPEMKQYIEMIKEKHPDVVAVHLLSCVLSVCIRDFSSASDSLFLYFDHSSLKWNDQLNVLPKGRPPGPPPPQLPTTTERFSRVDAKKGRYSVLLQSRLNRIFGNRHEICSSLLRESIQLSQMSKDETCLRMALIEMKVVGMEARLDASAATIEMNFLGEIEDRPELTNNQAEHIREAQVTQLCEILIDAIDRLLRADPDRCRRCLPNLLSACSLITSRQSDDLGKTRMVVDAAQSVILSALLMQGHTLQVRQMAIAMLDANHGDIYAKRHDTEPYAIAGVNTVYSLALDGKWKEAIDCVKQLKERFSMDNNWMCARHVSLCESLLIFDHSLLIRVDFSSAEQWIKPITKSNYVEGALRSSLLSACRGELDHAIRKLHTVLNETETKLSTLEELRIRMSLAMYELGRGNVYGARILLEEAETEVHRKELYVWRAMVARRRALVELEDDMMESCLSYLQDAEWQTIQSGSLIERALYAATKSRYLHRIGMTSDAVLWLSRWRITSEQMGVMVWVKETMREAAILYDGIDRKDMAEKAATEFVRLHDKYSHQLNWMLF